MPSGDRTGPMGLGPLTGRGAGYCAGQFDPARVTPGWGRPFGRGPGRGSGWCRWFSGTNVPGPRLEKQTEIGVLKVQAQELERVMKQVKERLAELAEDKQA
jgi:hypothetical protein